MNLKYYLSKTIVMSLILLTIILIYHFARSKFEETSSGYNVVDQSGSYGTDEKLPNSSTILIFYAPWCGHCKKSMKEFMKASKSPLVELVDADNQVLIEKYSVSGFPTILRKSDGKVYKGPRMADDIVEFASRN
jgi:thiol-disulfide isomerase/thioredoxin